MKKLLYFSFIILILACDNEYDVSDNFDLEELPGYVAFDAEGNNAIVEDIVVDEGAGSTSTVVENPTGTLSDITVNYELSGTATYGEDYTIEGASASGGSVVISSDRGSVAETFRATINVNIIDDSEADGDEMIEITLTSASNGEGDLAVGRGGTDYAKTQVIVITDND